MHLALRKTPFSVQPWRLGVEVDGRFRPLPGGWGFRTKRDGQPWLQRLQDVGDWRQPNLWTAAQTTAAWDLLDQIPALQQVQATVRRLHARQMDGKGL